MTAPSSTTTTPVPALHHYQGLHLPDDISAELGPQVTSSLADASGWIRHLPERVAVDLRHLTRTFPAILHPMLGNDRGSWVEMLAAADATRNDTVVVFGRIP